MKKFLFLLPLLAGFWSACQQGSTYNAEQTLTKGTVHLAVDESFAPIIDDQLMVFGSAYPEAQVIPAYKPENELLELLLNDSARVAVLSRELSKEEAAFYERKQIKIRVTPFAVDGLALITTRNNPDSLVNVGDLIAVMQGNTSKIKSLVFDNPNSSTVRFLKELAGVKELPKQGIYALKTNPEVIEFVAANPGSVGVVGINWIVQPVPELEAAVAKLKLMGVKNLPGKPGSDAYYKPTQNDLALGMYPLMRNLYLINCEGGPGPGTGFVTFAASERGQRIVLKSGLLPYKVPSREVIVRKKIN